VVAAELGNVYTIRSTATISTAITIIQAVAASTKPLIAIRLWVTESASGTGAQAGVEIVRKTAAGTTTAVTPVPVRPSQGTASFTAGHNASGEGTVTDVHDGEGFNVVNGWLWLPTPDEQIVVPISGILGSRFAAAPASQTWRYGGTFVEIG
jgi:hypothetical protein